MKFKIVKLTDSQLDYLIGELEWIAEGEKYWEPERDYLRMADRVYAKLSKARYGSVSPKQPQLQERGESK